MDIVDVLIEGRARELSEYLADLAHEELESLALSECYGQDLEQRLGLDGPIPRGPRDDVVRVIAATELLCKVRNGRMVVAAMQLGLGRSPTPGTVN